jgi:hypothetical protein
MLQLLYPQIENHWYPLGRLGGLKSQFEHWEREREKSLAPISNRTQVSWLSSLYSSFYIVEQSLIVFTYCIICIYNVNTLSVNTYYL